MEDQLLIINQKQYYYSVNHSKFLKFVYEFEFQNVHENLYLHEENVIRNNIRLRVGKGIIGPRILEFAIFLIVS